MAIEQTDLCLTIVRTTANNQKPNGTREEREKRDMSKQIRERVFFFASVSDY